MRIPAAIISTVLLVLGLIAVHGARADSRRLSPRIFGGGKSNATKSVSLLVESQSGKPIVYFCSGTFLSSTHFLTAKHCLAKNGFSKPVFDIFRSKGGAPIRVRSKVSSPTDDIAILTVAKTKVSPVPLMVSRAIEAGEPVNFYGYGKDQREKSALDSNPRHYLKYGTSILTRATDRFFSFENSSDGGLCHGDSGGPMLALNASQEPGVIGVASFFRGVNRCVAGNEGSYVNIQTPAALNFILAHAPEARLN